MSKEHPEDLLLKHAQFIIDNVEGIQSNSTWYELYEFDADSAIYTTSKPSRPKSKGESSMDSRVGEKSKPTSS